MMCFFLNPLIGFRTTGILAAMILLAPCIPRGHATIDCTLDTLFDLTQFPRVEGIERFRQVGNSNLYRWNGFYVQRFEHDRGRPLFPSTILNVYLAGRPESISFAGSKLIAFYQSEILTDAVRYTIIVERRGVRRRLYLDIGDFGISGGLADANPTADLPAEVATRSIHDQLIASGFIAYDGAPGTYRYRPRRAATQSNAMAPSSELIVVLEPDTHRLFIYQTALQDLDRRMVGSDSTIRFGRYANQSGGREHWTLRVQNRAREFQIQVLTRESGELRFGSERLNGDIGEFTDSELGLPPLHPSVVDPETGFTTYGVNSREVILATRSFNGHPTEQIECFMKGVGFGNSMEGRPGFRPEFMTNPPPMSYEAFLRDDARLLGEMAADNDTVLRCGLTHQDLARHLERLIYAGKRRFRYHGNEIQLETDMILSTRHSTFADGVADSGLYRARNRTRGIDLQFTGLNIEQIKRQGFYGGRRTKIRVEPEAIMRFMGIDCSRRG